MLLFRTCYQSPRPVPMLRPDNSKTLLILVHKHNVTVKSNHRPLCTPHLYRSLSNGCPNVHGLRTSFWRELEKGSHGERFRERGVSIGDAVRLFGLLLEEGDEVVAVLGLLEATEGHLGAGNVLLGVF